MSTADRLLRMWLTDGCNEMLRRAAKAERAYTVGSMRSVSERLARAYHDAACVFRDAIAELDASPADPPPAEPPAKDPSP